MHRMRFVRLAEISPEFNVSLEAHQVTPVHLGWFSQGDGRARGSAG